MHSPRGLAGALLLAIATLALGGTLRGQGTTATLDALFEAGRYADAEAEAARAMERASPVDLDRATGRFIDARLRNGRGAEARSRELAERLVKAHRLPGAPRGELAASLGRLGQVQYQSGDYTKAIGSLREAIALREAESAPDLPRLAADIEHLVDVRADEIARDPKTLDEGLALAERALAIRRQIGQGVGEAHALQVRG